MSAPVIISVTPQNQADDIVLGMPVTVVFDQPIDTTTVNESTFALMGPGQTALLDPFREILRDPKPDTGREYITGAFSFFASVALAGGPSYVQGTYDTAVFRPSRPLRPAVTYTCLIAGADSTLALDTVKNLAGVGLAASYQWTFHTGVLNRANQPVTSPIKPPVSRLEPDSIRVIPKPLQDNDLSQQIAVYFPVAVDPTSLDPSISGPNVGLDTNPFNDISVSVDPFLGDPLVTVPTGMTFAVRLQGNQLLINVGSWPAAAGAGNWSALFGTGDWSSAAPQSWNELTAAAAAAANTPAPSPTPPWDEILQDDYPEEEQLNIWNEP